MLSFPVSPFSVTEQNASSVLLVLSDTIPASTAPVSLASIETTLSSSSDLLKYLHSTSVSIKELSFLSRGSDGAPSVPSSSVPISNSSGSGIIPAAKAQTPGTSKLNSTSEELLQKPGNLDSLGVTIKKDGDDFGMWYRQVLTYGDMLDYYDVSGCYILKPASYCIWESIQGKWAREYFPPCAAVSMVETDSMISTFFDCFNLSFFPFVSSN